MKNKLIILLLIIISSYSTYFIFLKTKEINHVSSESNHILSDDITTSHKTTESSSHPSKQASSVEKINSDQPKTYTDIPKKVENNEGNNLSNSSTNVNNSSNSKIDTNSSKSSTTINHSDISNNLNQTKKAITISSFLSNLKSINYVLKSKETLTDIARKYENTCNLNTSIKIIKSINNISDGDNIDEGRTLLIPESTLKSGIMHPVVTGDTWYSIAQKYYSSYDVNSITTLLIYINDLPNNDLPLGESIFLPKI